MGYLYIFLGAGLGGVLRFALSSLVTVAVNGTAFPLGTFVVNMVGCLTIGYLGKLAETQSFLQGDGRLFIFVGLLGGFTTFSSYGIETFQLIRDGEIVSAIVNAVGQVVLGLTLVWLGFLAAKTLHG
ncbi:MAG: fluoride efflux transporter CrcB [Leptolyngbya sp.]|nr:fluoride efflux transporter CrcB [Candidatus Melainabacteria bacterium]